MIVSIRTRLLVGIVLLFSMTGVYAANLAVKDGIAACIKIDDTGHVAGALVVVSSGDSNRNSFLMSGVRNLHWEAKKSGEKRNVWFPLGFAINGATPPDAPANCGPPNS